MILSCHDSVDPSFRQRGELRDMPVQIDPLNNLLSRVMQEGRWPGVGRVPSPGADRTGHNENCWLKIVGATRTGGYRAHRRTHDRICQMSVFC